MYGLLQVIGFTVFYNFYVFESIVLKEFLHVLLGCFFTVDKEDLLESARVYGVEPVKTFLVISMGTEGIDVYNFRVYVVPDTEDLDLFCTVKNLSSQCIL